MFISRSVWGFVWMMLLLSISIGCSDEEKAFQKIPVAKLESSRCLEQIESNISSYINGKMSLPEVQKFWNCTDRAIRIFNQYVEDDKGGKYSVNRLYTFLKAYIFQNLSVPHSKVAPLLREVMILKKVLLGGDSKFIKKHEIEGFRSLLRFLEKESIALLPYVKTLNGRKKNGAFPKLLELEEAIAALESSLGRIGTRLATTGVGYKFTNFKTLLSIADELFFDQAIGTKSLNEWVKLIYHVKRILAGGALESIESSQWSRLLPIFGTAYGGYLKWVYHVQPSKKWTETESVNAIESIVSDGVKVLADATRIHRSKVIASSEVVGILGELDRLELLPSQVPHKEAALSWVVIVSEILSEEFPNRSKWRKIRNRWTGNKEVSWGTAVDELFKIVEEKTDELFPGIDALTIGKFNFEVSRWAEIQRKINSKVIDVKGLGPCGAGIEGAWSEMVCVSQSPWPLNINKDGDLVFVRKDAHYTRSSLSILNWERGLMRFLVSGYGDVLGDGGKKIGLSEEALKELYFDFKPLLVTAGLVGEENYSFYSKVFLQGNLFLARSDGDTKALSFIEGIEYLHYVIAGVGSGGTLVSDALQKCPVTANGSGESTSVEVSCYRAQFYKKFAEYLSHMPNLVRFMNSLSVKQWRDFESNLEDAVRANGSSDGPIETSDIREIFVLLQFIETFIFRFDSSYSETVSLAETGPALKVFGPLLANKMGLEDVESHFTYLLKNGYTVFKDYDSATLDFLHWQWHPERWEYEADRFRLSEILSSLSQLLD